MKRACPICGNRRSSEIFSASRQPATLNRLHGTRAQALAARMVDLRYRMCSDAEGCGFVWNAAFEPGCADYAPGYLNDQSQSPSFQAHLRTVRDRLAERVRTSPGDILEIGCGQADFLRSLCEETGRFGVGFDPAHQEDAAAANTCMRVHATEFDADAARAESRDWSLVLCRHLLEHLPQPTLIVREIAELLHSSGPAGTLYVEVPCVEWIARNGTFFDLFNEHCSLFSPRTLRRMLVGAGFTNVRIDRTFGGQYLAATVGFGTDPERIERPPSRIAPGDAPAYADLNEARQRMSDVFQEAMAAGPCAIWGAGAKGVSVVNHLGITDAQLPHLIDIHPLKQGCFAPITAQRVVTPLEFAHQRANREATWILVMNPAYLPEIRRQVHDLGLNAHVQCMDGRPRVAVSR